MLSRVDNRDVSVYLLLSRAYTEPRLFLLLIRPCWGGRWVCVGGWEKKQPG